MSYIPSNIVPLTSKNTKKFDIPFPSKGLLLKSGVAKMGQKEGYSCSMNNVIPKGDGLYAMKKSRNPLCNIRELGTFYKGTKNCFRGKNVFHAGNCLYTLSRDGTIDKIMEGLAEKWGMFCRFASKLYYYCDGYAYVTDKNFSCKKELGHAPHMFNVSSTGLVSKTEKADGGVFNLLCPRITVKYDLQGDGSYKFPLECDLSREIQVFKEDGETPLGIEIMPGDKTFSFKNPVTSGPFYVKYFFVHEDDDGYDDIFQSFDICCDFGSGSVSGSRIIASGSKERQGEYCVSDVLNPLYFPMNTLEKFGDGCDVVTGFLKVYSNLFVFTEGSVHKMSYVSQDGAGMFVTKLINNRIGCDISGSIALIDNRAVFANTTGGVYSVCAEDESGENNIKQISGNINKGTGGLTEHDANELFSSVSADFDGKYILSCSDCQYIWDYALSGFRNSSDYETSQGRLLWYKVTCGRIDVFFDFSDVLIAASENGDLVKLSDDTSAFDDGAGMQDEARALGWSFRTSFTDFGLSGTKKYVTSIKPDMVLEGECKVKMTVFADGKKYYENIICTKGDLREEIKLPKNAMYGFEVEFSCHDGVDFCYKGAILTVELT